MTGASIVFSYTPVCVVKVYELFERVRSDFLFQIFPLVHILSFLNSLMNSIICFIVCKSTRDDLKHFKGVLTRKIRRSCICMCKIPQEDVQTTNMNNVTRGLEIVDLNTRDAGTATMST